MDTVSKELLLQLDNKIKFVIPIFNGIPIPDSVVVTWIIMALLVIGSIIFVRNFKIIPVGIQSYIEIVVESINCFFEGILGEKGKQFVPYLVTVIIYIACSNISGLFGATPPTKDLNVTAGLAISSIFMVEYAGIKEKGIKGWLKGFSKPMAIITPINILEVFVRPLSLCMRLFGNVLGSFVIMELIKIVIPFIVPLIFSFYFDIFDGLIQAYVFVFLTSLFIKEAIE